MDDKSIYMTHPGVVYSHVCDYPVLASTRTALDDNVTAACVLNETGDFLWNQIRRQCSVGELIHVTALHFEEDEDSVREEILAFLDTLEKQGLIRRVC